MSKLLFTMTDAGRQELVNANKTGTNKVEIVSVGLGSRYYVTSTSQTNITDEIKRLTTIGGKVVSPDTIHVTAKDDSKDEYVVHTIGLYTNKGTLFAVYSQEQAIINKASSTIALISSDIAIKTLDTKNITFGDIEFINPPATETVVGVARFANEQEIDAGTDDSLAVSAKRLKQAIVKHEQSRNHPDATLTSKGFVQLSSATNRTSETLAATPKAVKAAYDLANGKYTAQDATTARKGIVQLSSATNSTSEVLAATPKAVKAAYDLANGKYTAQDATTAQKGIVQLSSDTNSTSETLAATPKAVKAAYDLAAGKAPSSHTHPWNQITGVPTASLTAKGITQLSSATNSTSEVLAATPKAVKAAYDLANGKYTAQDATTAQKGIVQLSSDTNSTSETLAATPKAVKAAYDLAAGKAPSSHTHPWNQITGVPTASLTAKGITQLSSATNSTSEVLAATPKAVKAAYDLANGKQAADATLTALAALATAADKLPYFTGVDRAALTALTSVGRAILGKTSIQSVLDYLGLGEGSALPVGVPVPWPSATPPTGWLKCNGAAFDKVKYPRLATAYPSGKLPDLRGEFIRGWDDGRGIDTGRALLSIQSDEVRKLALKYWGPASNSSPSKTFALSDSAGGGLYTDGISQASGGIINAFQLPGGNETRPRNVAFNYIVRAA
ncbi:tail fiber protein [Escherichia coli]|nr:tail fiber protein [Escherichia coli]